MLTAVVILMGSALLASGIVFRHQRVLVYLAAAGALFEAQWLLLVLLDRVVWRDTETTIVLTVGAALLLILWLSLIKRWRAPALGLDLLVKESVIIAVLLITLLAASAISALNGWQDGSWVTHSWYNSDTATLVSLVQSSLLTDGLVSANPFAAGYSLEYPTLLHAGIAELLRAFGETAAWLRLLPVMVLLQILVTVPLFFLLIDLLLPEPGHVWQRWLGTSNRWLMLVLQAGLVLFVMGLSWEAYVYPQGHFFVYGLLLLEAALLFTAGERSGSAQVVPLGVASVVGVVLIMSNAVLGAVSALLLVAFFMVRLLDRRRELAERILAALLVPGWLIVYRWLAAGDPQFGLPSFSYTAALDLLRLSALLVILAVVLITQLSRWRLVGAMVAALVGAAVFTFFFSTRAIIVDNAARFLYHALMISFPVLLVSLVRAWYWIRRELVYTTHDVVERGLGWLTVIGIAGVLVLPAGVSVAITHDHLMFKNQLTIDREQVAALKWLADNTVSNDVILASPDQPFAVPLFTGRSLLRTNYWLSPDDSLLKIVTAGFEGQVEQQRLALNQADFVLLTASQVPLWQSVLGEPLFQNEGARIYRGSKGRQ